MTVYVWSAVVNVTISSRVRQQSAKWLHACWVLVLKIPLGVIGTFSSVVFQPTEIIGLIR